MKLFNLDNPIMQALGKMADLMWLNILTIICCIPVITAGASLTAMNYMALKMVRNEECYITRGFFKSFKENFKQATVIWMLILLVAAILGGDYYIIEKSGLEFNKVLKVLIGVVCVMAVFTCTFVFPVLAKFSNTIRRTIKNAFVISLLQLPKTILIIILYIVPIVLLIFAPQVTPVCLLFGMSAPAFVGAMMYNKFFRKLEDQVTAAEDPAPETEEGEDERIFKDELDETLIASEYNGR